MTAPPTADLLARMRASLRRSRLVRWMYYDLHLADLPVLMGSKSFETQMDSAIQKFMPTVSQASLQAVRRDIKHCFCRYKTTPQEYFLFGFPQKGEQERDAYLPDSIIMKSVANKTGRKIHDLELNDKYRFYQMNKAFFKREAMLLDASTTLEGFAAFALNAGRIIAKPNKAALGRGVEIFAVNGQEEAAEVFERLKGYGIEYILEEVIKQSDEMARWNESSVNTIRINTFLTHGKFHILGPFIRTGRKGSIVDNGGQGGVFAAIDQETGIICTDGVDESANTYPAHPDSGMAYQGWQVPQWQELVQQAERAHRNMPRHAYVSWDFAHTENGWVLIEGNWGEFIQQIALKRGLKKDFLTLLNN